MEKKIIITKRFRNNTLNVYQYLLKKFSANTGYRFLLRLEHGIGFIINNPTVGKNSAKRKNVRSSCLRLIIKSFTGIKMRSLKFFASLICERTQRKNPIEQKLFLHLNLKTF